MSTSLTEPEELPNSSATNEPPSNTYISFSHVELEDGQTINQDALRPMGPSPSFHEFCKVLKSIASPKGVSRSVCRQRCLKEFFELWRKFYGNDMYPCVRLLLPHRDRRRSPYFVKELALARLYCKVLGLDKQTSSAAKQVLNWRRPTGIAAQNSDAGDFVQLLLNIIQDRCLEVETSLTIDEVNQQLDHFAAADSDNKKVEIIQRWLGTVAIDDHKWLLRIILQDLRLGINEYSVLGLLHNQATRLFNVCTDLKVICHMLYSSHVSLKDTDIGLKVFNVFEPMLAKRSRKDLRDIVRVMLSGKDDEFIIEEKMDGERMQVHKRGDQYRYWSRHGKEYTYLYGADRKSGCLTPWIDAAFMSEVEEVILDGEMLVWDPSIGKTQAFGSLKTFASRPTDDKDQARPLFKVFDVLYLKGKGKSEGVSFINKRLSARRQVMESGMVFREVQTRLELCYSVRGRTVQNIKQSLEKILEERGEGLIIKKLDSKYSLNRRTDDWIKVKPEYMDELSETFEVIAIGAYWGRGQKGGKFASFLVALVDDERITPSEGMLCYKTFCRVGTGISFQETEQIMKKLEGKYHDWNKKQTHRNPDWLVLGSFSPEVPDVWWHPKDSFLLNIKGAEIIPSQAFGCQSCLRFPRSIRFDLDRSIKDCMSYRDLLGLVDRPRSNKRVGTDLSAHVKKRKPAITNLALPTPSQNLPHIDGRNLIFYGAEFWIIQGLENTSESKSELELIVNQNGGRIVHTIPRSSSDEQFCISLTDDFWDAKKVIRQGLNLIHPRWIIDSVSAGKRMSLSDSRYIVHLTQPVQTIKNEEHSGTNAKVSEGLDTIDWGDTVECDEKPEDLASEASTTDDEIHNEEYPSDQESENDQEDQQDPQDHNFQEELAIAERRQIESLPELKDTEGIFYPMVFYLDTQQNAVDNDINFPVSSVANDANELFSEVASLLKQHGGRIVTQTTHPELTHIIYNKQDTSRCIDLMRRTKEPKLRRQVVTDWVFDSVEASAVLYEADYLPPL